VGERVLPVSNAYISELVIEEASQGDESAASLRLEKIAGIPALEVVEEVMEV
jgi:hypothetical protein